MYFKENFFTELHAVEKCLERALPLSLKDFFLFGPGGLKITLIKMTIKIFISIYQLYIIMGILNDIFLHAFNAF